MDESNVYDVLEAFFSVFLPGHSHEYYSLTTGHNDDLRVQDYEKLLGIRFSHHNGLSPFHIKRCAAFEEILRLRTGQIENFLAGDPCLSHLYAFFLWTRQVSKKNLATADFEVVATGFFSLIKEEAYVFGIKHCATIIIDCQEETIVGHLKWDHHRTPRYRIGIKNLNDLLKKTAFEKTNPVNLQIISHSPTLLARKIKQDIFGDYPNLNIKVHYKPPELIYTVKVKKQPGKPAIAYKTAHFTTLLKTKGWSTNASNMPQGPVNEEADFVGKHF